MVMNAMSLESAPASTVSPLADTLAPSRSPEAPSDATSFPCCDQVVPERTKMYAAP